MKKAIDIAAEQTALELSQQFGEITYDEYVIKLERLKSRAEAENEARGFHGLVHTLKKLKRCPVQYLFDKGKIDSGQFRAASDIAAGYQLITSDVSVKQCQYREPIGVMGNSQEDETARQFLLVQRYNAWAEKMIDKNVNIVLDVIVLGKSLRETDKKFRLRKQSSRNLVIESLDLYTMIRCILDRENRALVSRYKR